MPDKICPLVQDWHGYYGRNQLLPDWIGSLLHTRERDESDILLKANGWVGHEPSAWAI